MANQRIVDYWHIPAPDGFVEYLLRRAGLNGVYLDIAKNYRAKEEGDTVFYADKVQLDKENFNRKSATMHRAIVPVLVELAVEGWKFRQKGAGRNAKI